jgi:hypothetical protein
MVVAQSVDDVARCNYAAAKSSRNGVANKGDSEPPGGGSRVDLALATPA